jgi:serine/threonine protein kinase
MDFGLSIMIGIKGTIEKDISGTPLYMSPEHFSDTSLDPKSDIFSLGLIFYEMVVGEPAIEAENYITAMYKIAHEPITPPSSKNKTIDNNLDQIILKAVEKNSDLRYSSASQMIQDLVAYLDVYKSNQDEGLESTKIYSKISKYLVDIDKKAAAAKTNYTYASELANRILKDFQFRRLGKSIGKRFAVLAIEKGFITKEQFIEAMVVQIENDLEGMEHTLLGSILYRMGYLTADQINEVTESLNKGLITECPKCGILISDCPNCRANLRT